MVAPVLPGISDSDGHLRAIVEAALDAKATFVSPILLHLRPKVKEVYMAWLEDAYPDLVPRYQKMYAGSAYARKEERDLLGTRVDALVGKKPPRRVRPRARPTPPKPEQLSFGLEG
jgi:DNA repair photolyase